MPIWCGFAPSDLFRAAQPEVGRNHRSLVYNGTSSTSDVLAVESGCAGFGSSGRW